MICVNVTKEKQSNVRSSEMMRKLELFLQLFFFRGSIRVHSKDEYVEVTPKSIRLKNLFN
jgi:predicted membrane GTPase involved in stress response